MAKGNVVHLGQFMGESQMASKTSTDGRSANFLANFAGAGPKGQRHSCPMERSVEGGDGGFRWWAGASAAQLALGIYSYRRGLSGECGFMPIRAFGVASLYVGALASASIGAIRFCGIHSVADAKEVGENIRTGLGIRPRF